MKYYYDSDEYFNEFTDAVEGKSNGCFVKLYTKEFIRQNFKDEERNWSKLKVMKYDSPWHYELVDDFESFEEAKKAFLEDFWDEVESCQDEYQGNWPW